MKVSERAITAFVRQADYQPLKIKQLAKALKIRSREYPAFRKQIKEFISQGRLAKVRGGRIGIVPDDKLLQGKLTVTKSGKVFFGAPGQDRDIYIPGDSVSVALDGDEVEIRLTGRYYRGEETGEVVRVIKRAREKFIGSIQIIAGKFYLLPDDPRCHIRIEISQPRVTKLERGLKVVVLLNDWQDADMPPTGKIAKILGKTGDPGIDVLATMEYYGLPPSFPPAVKREAGSISENIPETEIARRLDLRAKSVFTIDPEDAQDHDDAVSIQKTKAGYRLGVHIADVSYYVTSGSKLDRQALLRSFSAYLVDRVIPMLPPQLSNNVCSLKENCDRLTISVFIDVDRRGNVRDKQICESVIRSRAKLSYQQVQRYLDTREGFDKTKRIGKQLRLMQGLATILMQRRKAEGSLDFDIPEYKVILNDRGQAESICKRERLFSHRLIEEFMLLANQVVAAHFIKENQPTLYRVHPAPEESKLESFRLFARSLGHQAGFGSPPQPKLIGRFLDGLRRHNDAELLCELLIRSLQKAVYQPENIGHFGLNFAHYLHFTSPIRRYPDLLVHRLLRYQMGSNTSRIPGSFKGQLKRISNHCNQREVLIMEAERETVRTKQIEFLSRQLGESYDGVISGIVKFGFFVRLEQVGIDGMVRLSQLENDYYRTDLKRMVVVGSRTRVQFRIGDKVSVRIANVNREIGEIDLNLIVNSKGKGVLKKAKGRRRKRNAR